MNTGRIISTWVLAAIAAMAMVSTGRTAEPDIAPFFGEYEGEAVTDHDGEIRKRDLRVKISPNNNGFTVNWISVTKRPDGKLKRKEYSIDFHPTRRGGIYRSGERRDLFGNPVPLDPMQGDPYVWARVHENTCSRLTRYSASQSSGPLSMKRLAAR